MYKRFHVFVTLFSIGPENPLKGKGHLKEDNPEASGFQSDWHVL